MDLSEHQHQRLLTSKKKEEKERIEEIYPIKAPEQKISESKNHKAAESIPPKNGKLHVENPRRRKTDVAVATTK